MYIASQRSIPMHSPVCQGVNRQANRLGCTGTLDELQLEQDMHAQAKLAVILPKVTCNHAHLLSQDVPDVQVAVCQLVGVGVRAPMVVVDEASQLQHLPGQGHVVTLTWADRGCRRGGKVAGVEQEVSQ